MIERQHRYRPDIDGLRAVAVIAVIAFHTEAVRFRNGFIGVDIFFVISGYLISGIIFGALEKKTFSFREFYVRRINRILPALITVLVALMVAGWFLMYDYEFRDMAVDVIGGSLFVANITLWKDTGYFSLPAKPLLHLWSLGVEEQFYLLWPLTAIIVWRSSKRRITWILSAIVAVSFLVGVAQVAAGYPTAAFYLPFGRFWEILAGALLQHVAPQEMFAGARLNGRGRWRPDVLAVLGAALVVASLMISVPEGTWPGWRASLPVAGTVLLIGNPASWLNRRVLSLRPLVMIGLISYPLYLWHWPLLVFSRMLYDGYIPRKVMVFALAMSFLLSAATFRYIEIPIRFGQHKRRSAARLLVGLALTALLGWACLHGWTGTRSSGGPVTNRKWGADWIAPPDGTVDDGKGLLIFSLPGDSSRTVFMMGDSHVNQYWPRVLELASHSAGHFPTVGIVGYGGCSPLPGVNRRGIDWARKPWECDRIYEADLEHARKPAVKTILISARWDIYSNWGILYLSGDTSSVPLKEGDPRLEKVFDRFAQDLRSLVASGKRVYIVLPNPTPETQYPKSRYPRRLLGFNFKAKLPVVSKDLFDSQTTWVSDRLREVARVAGATVIDPGAFLCSGKNCPTVTPGGMPVYRDGDHLRAGYVAKYVTYLDEVFR